MYIDFFLSGIAFLIAFKQGRYYLYASLFFIWNILDWFILDVDVVTWAIIFSFKELLLCYYYRRQKLLAFFLALSSSFLALYSLFWYYDYDVYILMHEYYIPVIYIMWASQLAVMILGGLENGRFYGSNQRDSSHGERYARSFFISFGRHKSSERK